MTLMVRSQACDHLHVLSTSRARLWVGQGEGVGVGVWEQAPVGSNRNTGPLASGRTLRNVAPPSRYHRISTLSKNQSLVSESEKCPWIRKNCEFEWMSNPSISYP